MVFKAQESSQLMQLKYCPEASIWFIISMQQYILENTHPNLKDGKRLIFWFYASDCYLSEAYTQKTDTDRPTNRHTDTQAGKQAKTISPLTRELIMIPFKQLYVRLRKMTKARCKTLSISSTIYVLYMQRCKAVSQVFNHRNALFITQNSNNMQMITATDAFTSS